MSEAADCKDNAYRERARFYWDSAYRWLCRRRCTAPANADIWHLRFHWQRRYQHGLDMVLAGEYRLSPMQVHRDRYGNQHWVQWSAHDALVLKWVALQVAQVLPRPQHCHHLKGHGGVSGSTRQVAAAWLSGDWHYVYRTDICGYYRHILKHQVASQLNRFVVDTVCRNLCLQWLFYSVEDGGDIFTPATSICRGSALSPLIGGSLLRHIDGFFGGREDLFYARYMDDFIFFTKTRWHLRKAVKSLRGFFELGGFDVHPDKTQIGRIDIGFDWLGIWYAREGPRIAPRAEQNHRQRCVRLYEQARRQGLAKSEAERRVHAYQARWRMWADNHLQAAMTACTGDLPETL